MTGVVEDVVRCAGVREGRLGGGVSHAAGHLAVENVAGVVVFLFGLF